MSNSISSARKSLKPMLLMLGIAVVLTACHAHDYDRRGPSYYSENNYWSERDRDGRHRDHWRGDHDRDGRRGHHRWDNR